MKPKIVERRKKKKKRQACITPVGSKKGEESCMNACMCSWAVENKHANNNDNTNNSKKKKKRKQAKQGRAAAQ